MLDKPIPPSPKDRSYRKEALGVTDTQPSILLVDDEPDVLDMMSFMLADDDYEIELALGARAALERMRERHFDIVVTDLKMPEVDGLALAESIKERSPNTRVIIASGFVTPEVRESSERIGVLGYVPKPFTREELRSALRRVLEGLVRPSPSPGQ